MREENLPWTKEDSKLWKPGIEKKYPVDS
jgi:hypothetical protein